MIDALKEEQSNGPHSLTRSGTPESVREQIVLDVPFEQVPHLLDYWSILVKRRWAVLSCLLAVFSLVAITTLKQKPIYQGRVLLEVKPEPPNILSLKDLQSGDSMDLETFRATQIKVMESRNLAERVVQSLHLYRNPEFTKKRILFGLMEADSKEPSATVGLPEPTSPVFRNCVSILQASLDVKPVSRTTLVELSYYSPQPQIAAQIANELASQYIDQNFQAKWDETSRAAEWLQKQLLEFKARMEKAEDDLQAYAQANSIVLVGDKQNLVTTRLEELQGEFTKAQEARFEKEALYKLVEAGKIDDLPGVLNDHLVQIYSERLTDLRREYARLTSTIKPSYPTAVQLQKQIDELEAAVARHLKVVAHDIRNQYLAAKNREASLQAALDQQTKLLNRMAESLIHYSILKRDVDTNRQLYDALLERLKESQITSGMKASNIRIVESAEVPRVPVRPRVLLNLVVGIILGLILGTSVAFFQEYMDNTLKDSDEVEKFLHLPTLGILPTFSTDGVGKLKLPAQARAALGSGEGHANAIQTNPNVVEAYRSLRTSILLSAHPVPKMLLITSALPGEGKTTTALNLGAMLASLGSRVVIVDCDMRRPNAHRGAGVENNPGFVPCLTGQIGLEEAILPVPGVTNLSVITCGPIPPNPAEVLSSPRANELLQMLRSQFDYVLVDSPPLLSVSDGRILATMTDAVVLVVHGHSTPYDIARRARATLCSVGARVLGVALNNLDMPRDGYSYTYYRYGYSHGVDDPDPGDALEHKD